MIPALVLVVASVLSGECGPVGNGCEHLVATTMANRLADDRWPDNLDGVLEAYYGSAPATPTSLRWAMQLVAHPQSLVVRGGYCYAYSDADRARMGWREGETVIWGGGVRLHLSGEWPGGE